ncbi:hypothetical protein AQUCO_00100007v1, partial [Aquilegia coerulea]
MKEERDSKRQKVCSQSEEAIEHCDMISDLSDSILVQILSFLPMEDAVKTGILSKRWDHLWTKVRSLYFNGPLSRKRTGQEKFISFVNHTLSLVDGDKIEEFSLDFNQSPSEVMKGEEETEMRMFDLDIDRWIRCAARRKVEVLHLNFSYNPSDGPPVGVPYKLPAHLFNNDSIEELMFCFCSINPIRPIQWNNLKSLFLYNIQLDDVLIQNILSGTPLLEILRLSECNGMRILNVTSPNLKSLALCLKSGPCLELSAPFVETLEISGDIEQYRLMNVSSLVDVQVNPEGQTIHEEFQTMLQGLLESVRHAKVIALSTRCLQVMSALEIKMPPTSSFGCNLLELKTSLTKWQLPGLKLLLRTSPTLQTLIIRMDGKPCKLSLDQELLPKYDFDEVHYWSSMLSFPCLRKTLKTVKIFDFSGGSSETALVEFLLKKSLVLQKMIIYNTTTEYVPEHSAFTSNDKFSNKSLNIERAWQK